MKSQTSCKIIISCFVTALAFVCFSCQKQTAEVGKAQTPTEAFQLLFTAVKAKDTEKIKQVMSKNTLLFANSAAQRQNQTLGQMLENGLTRTTKTDALPQIRDERIKDNFGSVEVYNQEDKRWEDLPYVLEDGGWKLAIGDLWKNTFKSPGKSKAQLEDEAANTMSNKIIQVPTTNANFSINSNVKTVEVTPENKQKK